jgi:CelD/BcsL family acetyltransferase involved in cellulose biosynthesis
MVLDEIRTTEKFAQLRSEWDDLLGANGCVFLTHEWLFTWWRHLADGRELSIVTAREDGRLCGVLPLALRPPDRIRVTPRRLEFLGSGIIGSDYLDVILRPGFEQQTLSAFADWLHGASHVLRLSQLRRGACVAQLLARALDARGWTVLDTKINICPFIDLSGHTWETYLASLTGNHRYNFHRRLKRLAGSPDFRLQQPSCVNEVLRDLDTLIELHRKRWQSRAEASEGFATDAIRAFHREFATLAFERNWLRLSTIWLGDRALASLYGLHYGDVFSFYQSGFDPEFASHSAGLVIMGLAIRKALEDGCVEYDLLHGDEEYKFHWTGKTRELGRIEIFPAHARLYRHALRINRTARRIAHRALQNWI